MGPQLAPGLDQVVIGNGAGKGLHLRDDGRG
jgi:hypothetical protein